MTAEGSQCRICLGSEGELLRPCPCRGSQGEVHFECLEEWHVSQNHWDLRCMTCKHRYVGEGALRLARALWAHVEAREERDPDRLRIADDLANALQAQGELPEAARMLREALEVWRRVFGAEHPDTLTSANNLASVLQAQGEL